VATAGLPAPSIAAPIRHIFRKQRNLTVLMGEAQRIDTARRVVLLEDGGEIGYDHLIVATGATHSYFGQDAWAPYAPGLKTLEDAFELRRRILLAFERAERESDVAARRGWLNFTVIGAGATGVEMAGTLAEIARHTLADEFRRIDTRDARIYLIEAGERVLPTYPAELSEKARRQLQRLGVEVRTGNRVIFLDAKGVVVKHKDGEERIASRTAIWAAGVAASPLGRSLEAPLDRAGRVKVEPDLTIPGHPEVSVIGDLAYIENNGTPVPGVSPAAKQMGRRAARNIVARLQGRPARPFRYIDYGILATVGRRAGVAVVGRLKLSGFPAWLMWLFTHIYFLIGFRNRLVVMIDWAWSYFTFQRHARIVIKPGMQQHESEM